MVKVSFNLLLDKDTCSCHTNPRSINLWGFGGFFRGINVNKSNVTFSIVVIGRCDYLVLMTITRSNVCVKTEYDEISFTTVSYISVLR